MRCISSVHQGSCLCPDLCSDHPDDTGQENDVENDDDQNWHGQKQTGVSKLGPTGLATDSTGDVIGNDDNNRYNSGDCDNDDNHEVDADSTG